MVGSYTDTLLNLTFASSLTFPVKWVDCAMSEAVTTTNNKRFPLLKMLPGFEHLPFKAVSRSVAPCQVSYSRPRTSDLSTQYLIAEML